MTKRYNMIGVILCAAASVAVAQDEMEVAKQNLEKWLETKRLISKEEQDWRLGKELMTDRVKVLEKELVTLRQKTSQLTNEIAVLDQKFDDVRVENSRLSDAVSRMQAAVVGFEVQLPQLLARIPDPVRERIKPLTQRLPQNSAETKISLPERFQNVIGILNEVGKANGEVAVATEVKTLADGRPTEVKTLYVGMGQAYYVSAKGDAGVGRPTTNGWVWLPANDLAAPVTDAMQILQNKATARFIPLPVCIQ
jgi:predicted RNase H-like nuclease (RuvC/YqgF family)